MTTIKSAKRASISRARGEKPTGFFLQSRKHCHISADFFVAGNGSHLVARSTGRTLARLGADCQHSPGRPGRPFDEAGSLHNESSASLSCVQILYELGIRVLVPNHWPTTTCKQDHDAGVVGRTRRIGAVHRRPCPLCRHNFLCSVCLGIHQHMQ